MATKQTVGELVYKITGNAKGLGATLSKTEQQVQGLGGAFNRMSKGNVAALAGLAAGVTALGATLVTATKKAAQFESRIGDIRTLIGDNKKDVDELRGGILELSRSVPRSADELGEAAYDVLSAGVTDASDALKVLESSSKLAVAGLGTTKEAVNIVTSAINAYGFEAEEVDRISGVFFQTVADGKNTVQELALGFGRVAPLAASVGIEFEELQASAATLTSTGLKASESYTALRASIISLQKPTGSLIDIYEELGVATGEELIEKSGGLVNAWQAVQDKADELGLQFSDTGVQAEAMGAIISLTDQKNEKFNETLDKMLSGSNNLEAAFGRQAETTENQLMVAQNQMNELLIELGTKVLPEVNAVLKETIEAIDGLRAMSGRGGSAIEVMSNRTEQLGAQGNLLAEELEKAKKGTSEFTEETVKSALKANIAQQEQNKLRHILQLLSEAEEGNVITRRNARKELEAMGVDLKDYRDGLKGSMSTSYLAARASEEFTKELEDNNETLGSNVGNLSKVLKPLKEHHEQIEKNTESEADLSEEQEKQAEAQQEAEQAAERARAKLESFQNQMVSLVEEAQKTREALEKDLTKSFNTFSEDITSNIKDTNERLAEMVADAEEKQKELREKIKGEDDADRKSELREQLKEQEAILNEQEGFEERRAEKLKSIRERLDEAGIDSDRIEGLRKVATLEERLEEERRLRSLNEFERFEEMQYRKLDKLTEDFIREVQITEEKIEKQKELEQDLTSFLTNTNKVRTDAIDAWADRTLKRHGEVASSLKNIISLQSRVKGLTDDATKSDQYNTGGLVGSRGGEVHAGEYVIPTHLVSRLGGVVNAIEDMRQGGGSIDNSKTITSNLNVNRVDGEIDIRALNKELAWEMGNM